MARASRPGSNAFSPGQRALQVQRADHAVLGRAERQVDHRHRRHAALQRAVRLLAAIRRSSGLGSPGSQPIAAARDDAHLRQQRGERADGGGLAGAAIAEDQHAADAGIDGGDQEGQLHLVLADDGGEGKRKGHATGT